VFRHRLALALHRTVDELEATMSVREFKSWQKLDAQYVPLPDRLNDLHTALLASLMVNLQRASDAAPTPMSEFFIIKDREPPAPAFAAPSEIDRLRAQWRGG
jgi:hypothetical protein